MTCVFQGHHGTGAVTTETRQRLPHRKRMTDICLLLRSWLSRKMHLASSRLLCYTLYASVFITHPIKAYAAFFPLVLYIGCVSKTTADDHSHSRHASCSRPFPERSRASRYGEVVQTEAAEKAQKFGRRNMAAWTASSCGGQPHVVVARTGGYRLWWPAASASK